MTHQMPSIHEAFNARSLSREDLCNSFIISNHFHKLAASNNTIMIGPRGSGKTTLMRMLEVQSLEIWNHPLSNEFRDKINFSGVFIPTDRVWKTQYEKTKQLFESDSTNLNILQASFTYHVLERLVATLAFRVSRTLEKKSFYRATKISKSDEYELVNELSNLWRVTPRIGSLKSLEIAITTKKHEISNYLSKISLNINEKCQEIPEIIVGSIQEILGNSVRIININLEEAEHKWAFLFDELELAPDNIVQPLVDSMRGGPDNILFKLSLSPYHRGVSITSMPESSMKDQDLVFISLTGADEGYDFSRELCGNIFKKHNLIERPVEGYFEQPNEMIELREFKELAEKDRHFSSYLSSQCIDLDDFDKYTEKDKRPTIRKIKFVVQLRNYYRKKDAKKGRRRPPDLYGGFHNICKAMEYNPRMLIGIMNKLIQYAKNDQVIPIHEQISCLEEMTDSFKALLSTIAVDTNNRLKSINTLYDLVDVVAISFQKEISGDEFHPEPKGSLTFRKRENDCLIEAVGFALNSGAFVAEKGNNDDSYDVVDIRKIRCRLSNIFSHEYGLLLSNQREIDLSEIVKLSTGFPNEEPRIIDLFDH